MKATLFCLVLLLSTLASAEPYREIKTPRDWFSLVTDELKLPLGKISYRPQFGSEKMIHYPLTDQTWMMATNIDGPGYRWYFMPKDWEFTSRSLERLLNESRWTHSQAFAEAINKRDRSLLAEICSAKFMRRDTKDSALKLLSQAARKKFYLREIARYGLQRKTVVAYLVERERVLDLVYIYFEDGVALAVDEDRDHALSFVAGKSEAR